MSRFFSRTYPRLIEKIVVKPIINWLRPSLNEDACPTSPIYSILLEKRFEKIDIKDEYIVLLKNDNLYLLEDDSDLELLVNYQRLEDFDICNNYLWAHNNTKAFIYFSGKFYWFRLYQVMKVTTSNLLNTDLCKPVDRSQVFAWCKFSSMLLILPESCSRRVTPQ